MNPWYSIDRKEERGKSGKSVSLQTEMASYLPYRYGTKDVDEKYLGELKVFLTDRRAELATAAKKAAKANLQADTLRDLVNLTERELETCTAAVKAKNVPNTEG